MKLKNAFNFVQMHLEDFDPAASIKEELYPTDQWLLDRLNNTI